MYSLRFMHAAHSDGGYTMYHCNTYSVMPAAQEGAFVVRIPPEPDSGGLREMSILVSNDPDRDYAELYVMEGGKTIDRVVPQGAVTKD